MTANFIFLTKIGPIGVFRRYKIEIVKGRSLESLIRKAVEIEKRMNSGLLSHDAEKSYAKKGFHKKPIFKIHVCPNKYKEAVI